MPPIMKKHEEMCTGKKVSEMFWLFNDLLCSLFKDSFSDLFQATDIQEQEVPNHNTIRENPKPRNPSINQSSLDTRSPHSDESASHSKSKFRKSFSDVLNSLRKK